MTPRDAVATIYYVCATIGLVAVVGKLFYGWFRGDQISKGFIIEVAEEHLPHIYHALTRLQMQINVPILDPPPIRFVHHKDKK